MDLFYLILPELFHAIDEHAEPEGYAVVLQRTKKFWQEIFKKAWISSKGVEEAEAEAVAEAVVAVEKKTLRGR